MTYPCRHHSGREEKRKQVFMVASAICSLGDLNLRIVRWEVSYELNFMVDVDWCFNFVCLGGKTMC